MALSSDRQTIKVPVKGPVTLLYASGGHMKHPFVDLFLGLDTFVVLA